MRQFVFSLFFIFPFGGLLQTGSRGITGEDHAAPAATSRNEKLLYPALVDKFYLLNDSQLFWTQAENDRDLLRQQLFHSMDTAFYWGLTRTKYHAQELKAYHNYKSTDSLNWLQADRLFTDAAIALCKDIYQGHGWVGFDQLSANSEDTDNDYLLQGLLNAPTPGLLKEFIEHLEPADQEYASLKQELRKQKAKHSKDTVAMLHISLDYYRWIHHFNFDQFIVVNLPSATLQYFEKDSQVLFMKTVLGKPSTPTPRFASVCDQVILYPYWYVPRSIIFNEYLSKIKNDPYWLDAQNMQVIDGKGKVLDHHKLNWAAFHPGYFPYLIRQSTGCDNALGVLKLNIVTPYGVYLHDTNNKTAFLSGYRFYSHGCMRMEEPLMLGNRLLAGRLDTTFLQSCFKEQKPVPVWLEKPVPVFAVYMPALVVGKASIRYYKDIYKLMGKVARAE